MKILLVQLGRFGDMILLSPLIKAINEKYPDAKIDLLAGRANFAVMKDNPRIDRIIILNKEPKKIINTIREIRREKYDYLIDPKDHKSTESGLIAKICRAKTKVGFNPEAKSIFDISIPSDKENIELHYVDRAFNSVKELDIDIPALTPRPELFLDPNSEEYLNTFIEEKKKIIVVNISASHPRKMWPNEKWIKLLNRIKSEKYQFILSYAPSEKDRATEILENHNWITEFKSRSMNDVFSLIEKANLLISPDTALVHVAAAFNTPLLGFFSSLDDQYIKFKPLSDNLEILRAKNKEGNIHDIEVDEADIAYRKIIKTIF